MCLHTNSTILSSRIGDHLRLSNSELLNVDFVRRRRLCSDCGYRWTTYEIDAEVIRGISIRQSDKHSEIKEATDRLSQLLH